MCLWSSPNAKRCWRKFEIVAMQVASMECRESVCIGARYGMHAWLRSCVPCNACILEMLFGLSVNSLNIQSQCMHLCVRATTTYPLFNLLNHHSIFQTPDSEGRTIQGGVILRGKSFSSMSLFLFQIRWKRTENSSCSKTAEGNYCNKGLLEWGKEGKKYKDAACFIGNWGDLCKSR